MSRFPGVDLLEVDALLTAEERMVRDTVRAFVDDRVKPIIEECHREGRTPLELVPEMGALGLFGASISDYGLPGLGGVAYGLIMQELERGDSGLRSFASVQSSLVMYPIHAFGSQQQKDRWIPRLATGEAIGCFGLTLSSTNARTVSRTIRSSPVRSASTSRRSTPGKRLTGTPPKIGCGELCG